MKIDIVLHPNGDWEGLYINGKLVEEGHSIRAEDIVPAINKVGLDTWNGLAEPLEFNQFEGDIKKEMYIYEDGHSKDIWWDYPSNMPDELPNKI